MAAPRIYARAWLALAAGLGCAACAYAGLYPRFDQGTLRGVLALTSAPFGAAVVATALGARSAGRAFSLTLLLAAILGMASIVLPGAMLVGRSNSSENYFGVCLFGFFFGGPTGAAYGIPLGILVALGHRHVRGQTHVATDRAARVAGAWLFFVGLLALLGIQALDSPTMDYATNLEIPPSPLPSLAALAAALGGVLLIAQATARLRRRTAWLQRVGAGLEPAFRLRLADVRDRVAGLPRVSDGATVVEWCPEERSEATAYRTAASGIAVALVDDRPELA